MPYLITTLDEYQLCISRGFAPLVDTKNFEIEIKLRVQIQRDLFGVYERGRTAANLKFYRWVWDHKKHYCEETLKPLHNYSASYVSHILARGAFPEIAHDPRNVNILCLAMHNRWENGERETMRIYPGNVKIIEKLTLEYQRFYENK